MCSQISISLSRWEHFLAAAAIKWPSALYAYPWIRPWPEATALTDPSSSLSSLLSVCQEANSLCDLILTYDGESRDLSTLIFKSVINIICTICFNISFENKDPILTTIQTFTEGIVDVLGHSDLVDIFPWLKVRRRSHCDSVPSTFSFHDHLSLPTLPTVICSASYNPRHLVGIFILQADSHIAHTGLEQPKQLRMTLKF